MCVCVCVSVCVCVCVCVCLCVCLCVRVGGWVGACVHANTELCLRWWEIRKVQINLRSPQLAVSTVAEYTLTKTVLTETRVENKSTARQSIQLRDETAQHHLPFRTASKLCACRSLFVCLLGSPDWNVSMVDVHLGKLLWVYCPGHAGVKANDPSK